jgi:hypothetical protein
MVGYRIFLLRSDEAGHAASRDIPRLGIGLCRSRSVPRERFAPVVLGEHSRHRRQSDDSRRRDDGRKAHSYFPLVRNVTLLSPSYVLGSMA